jgi:hypothetical protein
MLPHFFRHYDHLIDKYFVYDNGSTDESIPLLKSHRKVAVSHFEVTGDSFVAEECRLADTFWQGSEADWVIVTDIDEHLYRPDMKSYLQDCTNKGITAIRSIGYEMVCDSFPSASEPLSDAVTNGQRSPGHDRLCIFNPKALTATNFGPGRHVAKPEGHVVWPDDPEVLLLHYKRLGLDYLISRSAELKTGLRKRDLAEGWGRHYTWTSEQIAAEWHKTRQASGPVPGLGHLKHIEPAHYSEEENAIRRAGLVDEAWYLNEYPDVRAAASSPLPHYCHYGWKEGRKPNFYFDATWYRAYHPQSKSCSDNPLYDYIVHGETLNAPPSAHFDPHWYRIKYGLSYNESPLQHYLQRRKTGLVSPSPFFDAAEYCKRHPDVLASGLDAFEHHFRNQAPSIRS